jgi:hypothetical protein
MAHLSSHMVGKCLIALKHDSDRGQSNLRRGIFGVLGVQSNKKKVGGDSCAGIAAGVLGLRSRVSRILFIWASFARSNGRPFLWDPDCSGPQATYPQGLCRPGRAPCIFGLAAGGVCRAVIVTDDAVRSYRTISPLPNPRQSRGL